MKMSPWHVTAMRAWQATAKRAYAWVKMMRVRPLWMRWNQNIQYRTFSRVPAFPHEQLPRRWGYRCWAVNFTKGNYSSCLPSPLIDIPVLLLSLTQVNCITFLGSGNWVPAHWCRNLQPSGCLPIHFEIANDFWAARRNKVRKKGSERVETEKTFTSRPRCSCVQHC